jgi:hypothetical protein
MKRTIALIAEAILFPVVYVRAQNNWMHFGRVPTYATVVAFTLP